VKLIVVTSIEDPGVAPSSIRIITAPQDVPAGGPNIEATIEEEVLPGKLDLIYGFILNHTSTTVHSG
jgi:hypothetical protein